MSTQAPSPEPADPREIPLSLGLVAIVDAADLEWLMTGNKWYAMPHRQTFYAKRQARRADGRRTTEYMHRLLLPGCGSVDHADGNGLNNRRGNLRPATKSQNQINTGLAAHNSSGYKGVSFSARYGTWSATLGIDGKSTHLGVFSTAEEAALAYDERVRSHYGDYGRYNFPKAGERGVHVYASTSLRAQEAR